MWIADIDTHNLNANSFDVLKALTTHFDDHIR